MVGEVETWCDWGRVGSARSLAHFARIGEVGGDWMEHDGYFGGRKSSGEEGWGLHKGEGQRRMHDHNLTITCRSHPRIQDLVYNSNLRYLAVHDIITYMYMYMYIDSTYTSDWSPAKTSSNRCSMCIK